MADETRVASLGHLELFCRDVTATRSFYEDVLGMRAFSVQGPFVWLDAGPLEILLRPGSPPAASVSYATGAAGLVLYTHDLPATLARLAAAGVRPVDEDAGCQLLRDPDGRWVQLVDPRQHQ